MPTTNDEAEKILSIAREYLTRESAKSLFGRLDDEVGKFSDNSSVRTSITMMRMLVDPPMPPAPRWVYPSLIALVTIHFALIIAFGVSFCLLPFYAPFYISIPLMAFIVFFSTNRVDCKLTEAENVLRGMLGKKKISAFVGHYVIKPIKSYFR